MLSLALFPLHAFGIKQSGIIGIRCNCIKPFNNTKIGLYLFSSSRKSGLPLELFTV